MVASIPTGVAGLLPEGIVGLVLGCGLLSFQGISVVSDVVNSDYTWEIKVLISSPAKTVQRHLAPDARMGIIGQKTVDLNSIRMGLRSPSKYRE